MTNDLPRPTIARQRSFFVLLALSTFLLSTGCSLTRPSAANNAPIVFQTPPNLDQVISAINENSDRVRQLSSDSVRLSIPGQLVALRSTIDFDRMAGPNSPGRFRLSGDAMGARQLDLGSNDNEYWMWVKPNKPPTVFWGRHSEFYQSAAQQFLPMPPSWLIDALGVVHLDPAQSHQGPFKGASPGLLQIRTAMPTPRGNLLRILEIDEQRALIVQQQIFGPQDELLASADSSNFKLDPASGATLPHSIKVKLPPAGLAFDFEVDRYTINQPVDDPERMWTVPDIPEHRYLNLANPNDMRGITLLGSTSPDFYDRQQVVAQPPPITRPRVTWRERFGLPTLR